MKTEAGISLHNKFDFTLIDAKTKKVKGTYTSYNVVLDLFIDCIKGNAEHTSDTPNTTIAAIAVGTGTGDLSTSRTNLFDYKGQTRVDVQSVELLDQGINKIVYAGTFSETEVVDNLTEVGLCRNVLGGGYGRLYTHSLITDSEGNPITIEKTDADILHVQATVYSKISVEGPLKFTRVQIGRSDLGMDSSKTYRFPADYTLDNSWYNDNWGKLPLNPEGYESLLVGFLPRATLTADHFGYTDSISSHWDYEAYLLGTTKPISHYDVPSYYSVDLSTPAQAVYYSSLDRLRIQTQLMASTKGNYPSTWLVKGIGFGDEYSGLWGYMSFPNHDIYLPKEFTFTLTGDGETTEFNLPIPEVMTEGVEIKINDAVVGSSNYTFSGKNFNMSQAWASTDNRYMVQTGLVRPTGASNGGAWLTPLFPSRLAKNTYARYNEPIIYDFVTPKKVNTFRMNNIEMSKGDTGTFILQYSNDGATWLEAATKQLNSGEDFFNLTFDPIEARYWRVDVVSKKVQSQAYGDYPESEYIGVNDGTDPQTVLFCGFDYVEPGIKFNVPPAEGASITVTCKCEYPIMNSNWRVDPIIIDLNITRGENFSEV